MRKILILAVPLALSAIIAACSSDSSSDTSNPAGSAGSAGGGDAGAAGSTAGGAGSGTPGSEQLPATGSNDVTKAWLEKGYYKKWKCEEASHDARSPSPHGKNRICSNDLSAASGAGEYPVGAANVKELYDDAGASVIGYAIETHVKAGADPDSWYWYEFNPAVGAPPKDGVTGLVANGLATDAKGPEATICVGCHSAAGKDKDHFGHDFVYTQVGALGSLNKEQLPVMGTYDDTKAWLDAGYYKKWKCEEANHDARSPSPHGKNRICSNDLSTAHGTGEYPVGAANVKELYDDAGASIIGYAIETHVKVGSGPDSWYWFEFNPAVGAPPKDGVAGLVANGLATDAKGPEATVCVGCHSAAGSDAKHFGHDLVYTQVK
jgi:cytochrome c553